MTLSMSLSEARSYFSADFEHSCRDADFVARTLDEHAATGEGESILEAVQTLGGFGRVVRDAQRKLRASDRRSPKLGDIQTTALELVYDRPGIGWGELVRKSYNAHRVGYYRVTRAIEKLEKAGVIRVDHSTTRALARDRADVSITVDLVEPRKLWLGVGFGGETIVLSTPPASEDESDDVADTENGPHADDVDEWHEYLDDSALDENDTDERIVAADVDQPMPGQTALVDELELTPAGRQYAELRPDSIVCRVALNGIPSGWPRTFVETAIRTCNEKAEHPADRKPALYVSNRGRVACPEHGGNYFHDAYTAKPDRFRYVTPLDVWQRLPESAADDPELVCDGCHPDDDDEACSCGGTFYFDRDTSATTCDRCGRDIGES